MAAHIFGGDWTGQKLDRLSKYLNAYVTALKNQPFHKRYIDAFAGTGTVGSNLQNIDDDMLPLEDECLQETVPFRDGSARIALQTEPPFDEYIFIERNASRCTELEKLATDFPTLESKIKIENSDCNSYIQELCSQEWKYERAVLFLDPYGMQVDWSTMKAVADTKCIDVVILFPHAIAVNRLLKRDAEIPDTWKRKLDNIFGDRGWEERFYSTEPQSDLWIDEEQIRKSTTPKQICQFYLERLDTIFEAVLKDVYTLRNSQGTAMFALCFACGNKYGARVALPIAKSIFKD